MFSLILVFLVLLIIVDILADIVTMSNSIYIILGMVLGCAATLAIAIIGLGLV